MIFTEAALPGAFVIELAHIEDERGFFARTYCKEEFAARGLCAELCQCSISYNARKGTLRGLHFQIHPHEEQKLVRCSAGAVFDVIVDLRTDSSTFRGWLGMELSAANRRAVYIPKGFAHGFISLSDHAEVLYMISAPYAPGFSGGVRWNDPLLGIEWPLPPAVVSMRDASFPLLEVGAG